ncbi:H-type small acid-soluble spore protein [Cytobacillus sp. Sa5YUA1]|uniref:H-type small acid-soluble spore protein n=1 Tax=Cytobacillus stercorigallinarum TaxID=2762240 RepID=A0ABR8QQB8_9BACI|nr:H-type small acid-soluble spore protein [Cytobacillus stercorigallinarum]MBD7937741.1 H-type small acid-soluble spore protein [Cytobacillus stercorigallinarum]
MDLSRARELLNSHTEYEVTFDGVNIVIVDLYELTKMARVYDRNNIGKNQVVPLAQLIEVKQIR